MDNSHLQIIAVGFALIGCKQGASAYPGQRVEIDVHHAPAGFQESPFAAFDHSKLYPQHFRDPPQNYAIRQSY